MGAVVLQKQLRTVGCNELGGEHRKDGEDGLHLGIGIPRLCYAWGRPHRWIHYILTVQRLSCTGGHKKHADSHTRNLICGVHDPQYTRGNSTVVELCRSSATGPSPRRDPRMPAKIEQCRRWKAQDLPTMNAEPR